MMKINVFLSGLSIAGVLDKLDQIWALIVFCLNVVILLANIIYKIIQKFKNKQDQDIDYLMLAKFSEDLKKYYDKNKV